MLADCKVHNNYKRDNTSKIIYNHSKSLIKIVK